MTVAEEHGKWGENVVVEYLSRKGFRIVERNVRPVEDDLRFEIDIVAMEKNTETLVFVEVKQHRTMSPYARRMRSVDKRKKMCLRRAFQAYRRTRHWSGAYRFDIVEVYGVPEGGEAVIDHIDHVPLFGRRSTFVRW